MESRNKPDQSCTNGSLTCPYYRVGCEYFGSSPDDIKVHVNTQEVQHSELLVDYMVSMREQLVDFFQDIEAEMDGIKRDMQRMKEQREARLREELRLMWTNTTALDQQQGPQAHNEIELLRAEIRLLRQKQEEMQPLVFGGFLWRIERLTQLREDAQRGRNVYIDSDAFYSHVNGYKFCLTVEPDSHGPFKGTYMHIGFMLMRGPFDGQLSWPCRRRVEMTVLRQDDGSPYATREYQLDAVPNTHKHCFNKPSTDVNPSYGSANFIRWADLVADEGVYRNDSICVRCRILPPS